MAAFLHSALAWIAAQAKVMGSVAAAVASNHPEPARQVVIYMAVLAVLLAFVPKIVKKLTK